MGVRSTERPIKSKRGRRSQLEIYIEILTHIRNGVKKPTQIMYAANLSWIPFKGFMEKLVERGHVQELCVFENQRPRTRKDNRTKRTYQLTEKGKEVIRHLKGERELVNLLRSL